MKLVLMLICLIVISCGKDKKNHKTKITPPEIIENEVVEKPTIVPPQGIYVSYLRPLNTKLSGYIPSGKGFIEIDDKWFMVQIYMDDASPVVHKQAIFSGSRCPQKLDDLNADGFIDEFELERASGKMLIPLDSRLLSQEDGFNSFPYGANYLYKRTIELEVLISDLKGSELKNFKSPFTKMEKDESLNLDSRIIVIFGTRDSKLIPETASFKENKENHLNIPIACGKIQKDNKVLLQTDRAW